MILKIEPTFSQKIWGGEKIKELFPKANIASINNIGEAWIVSGYPENESRVENFDQNLGVFYKTNKHLFNDYPSIEFPLLIKLLDAAQDLSVQVHPDNEQAKALENYSFGKQECWYILDNYGTDRIIIGTKTNDLKKIRELINQNKWSDIFEYQKIKPGAIFDITPGTLHAILGGTFLYELQQSSNITYRFFDYDRKDAQGNKRDLHVEKALKVLNPFAHSHIKEETFVEGENLISKIISNDYFSLRKISLKDKLKLSLHKKDFNFLILTCIKGEGTINGKQFKKYESFIVTSDELSHIELKGDAVLLMANPN